jgi:Anti-sigma-K factor rskA
MTERHALTCDDFLDAAAAVTLHASDAEEARRVDEHAATCASCRARLDEFRETSATLGMFAPQIEPPSILRTRLMKTVGREPRRLWPRLLRRPPTAWGVAAASLLVSIGALFRVIMMQAQINDLRQTAMMASERAARYDHVVEVLASDRLAIRPLQPVSQDAPMSGMIYMDPGSGTGMVMCHNLPPIQQGHAYQIWFVRGQERVSGGLLWPDHYGNGYTLIQVPQDVQSFDSIGLTDEPGTGSAWPTTPRVIGTRLKDNNS